VLQNQLRMENDSQTTSQDNFKPRKRKKRKSRELSGDDPGSGDNSKKSKKRRNSQDGSVVDGGIEESPKKRKKKKKKLKDQDFSDPFAGMANVLSHLDSVFSPPSKIDQKPKSILKSHKNKVPTRDAQPWSGASQAEQPDDRGTSNETRSLSEPDSSNHSSIVEIEGITKGKDNEQVPKNTSGLDRLRKAVLGQTAGDTSAQQPVNRANAPNRGKPDPYDELPDDISKVVSNPISQPSSISNSIAKDSDTAKRTHRGSFASTHKADLLASIQRASSSGLNRSKSATADTPAPFSKNSASSKSATPLKQMKSPFSGEPARRVSFSSPPVSQSLSKTTEGSKTGAVKRSRSSPNEGDGKKKLRTILPENYKPGPKGTDKPFYCPVTSCDRSFSRNYTLTQHMEVS
jgi:hypothetical protein